MLDLEFIILVTILIVVTTFERLDGSLRGIFKREWTVSLAVSRSPKVSSTDFVEATIPILILVQIIGLEKFTNILIVGQALMTSRLSFVRDKIRHL